MNVLEAKMMIDGKTVDSSNGRTFDAVNPFTSEVWATVPDATETDVNAAVAAAKAAFPEWGNSPGVQRAKIMNTFADLIEAHADRLALWETTDNGKVIRETKPQMLFFARNLRFFAGYADKLYGRTIPMDNPQIFDYTVKRPYGVCALITAWNSPIGLLGNKLAPALAAGNTVVVKPSEHASVTTLEVAKLALEAGLPAGVFNVVTGAGLVGDTLTKHPDVAKISFTGGGFTGSRIAANAAERLVPVTMELGGKSPNIIFEDADLDRAIVGAVAGIFGASGQTCIAGSRLLVQRSVYDRVVKEVSERAAQIRLGDPRDETTEMGPVANNPQFERLMSLIETTRASGARVTTGGDAAGDEGLGEGLFIRPTVIADVDPKSTLAQEEAFGPILAAIPFDTEEEAIALANSTEFGLASGVWTRDLSRALRVSQAIEAGMVWVNTYRASGAQAPFGGTKKSGYGRERGEEALDEYLYTKNVMIDTSTDVRDPFVLRT